MRSNSKQALNQSNFCTQLSIAFPISHIRRHYVVVMNEKFFKWCICWTRSSQRTSVGLRFCSSFWKKEIKNLCQAQCSFPPIWCFVFAFACSLGVRGSRLTEREHMGTQSFRLIQRWMLCLWREQTMFEVFCWMLPMLFCFPFNPTPSLGVYLSWLSQRLQLSDFSHRQKGGNKDQKRGRRRERKSINW